MVTVLDFIYLLTCMVYLHVCIILSDLFLSNFKTSICVFLFCLFSVFILFFVSNTVVVSQERALLLYLRYASRWGNQTMRGFIKVNSSVQPARHCPQFMCPCQFIEQHLKCKPQGKFKYLRISYWCSVSEYYD